MIGRSCESIIGKYTIFTFEACNYRSKHITQVQSPFSCSCVLPEDAIFKISFGIVHCEQRRQHKQEAPPIFRALQASSATRAEVRKANCEKVRLMYLVSFGTLTRISDEIEQPENMFSPCVAQRLRHLSQLDHWCGTFVVASIPPTAGCGR